MRIISAFLILFLFCVNMAFAQSEVSGPFVSHAVYFDVSPPLRDMVKMNDEKADMTWKDGVVKNILYPAGYNRPVEDANFIDPIVQSWNGRTVTDTTIANFDGVGANSGVCPPDTDGDVGPNHFFAVVNLKYAIYTKTGGLLFGPVNNSSVWSGMPNNSNDGDAIVLYDQQADRWLFTQFSLPNYPNGPFYMMIAISQTPDPTGSWYRYQFSFTSMPDYPKFGVWGDGYYMSMNRFQGGGSYQGIGAVAFERSKMLTGDATAAMVMFTLSAGADPYSMLPSDCDSDFPPAGTPNYFAYLNDNPDRIGIYKFTTDWTNTANSTFLMGENIGVASFNGDVPGGIPQKGTSVEVEDMAGRLMNRLVYRQFTDHWSMVANATVNVGSDIAGIRWWELRKTVPTASWSKYQEGTFAPADGHYRWMGSIAIDEDNNIALGYSISSSTMYPSIRYTGRMNCDPLGEMTLEESGIINGGGSQTNTWSGNPSRWGDYSRMVTDPSSPNTFWYTQEYYQTTSQANWKTRIASFSLGNLMGMSATAAPGVICLGDTSQLNADACGGSGTYTYTWTSDPPGFTSNSQNPTVTPAVTTRYYVDVTDGTITKTDSADVTVNQLPTVFAGNDTTYCSWMNAFPIEGSGELMGNTAWTTAGDGSFSNYTALATNYVPGPADRAAGTVTLTLTAQALSPCTGEISDDIVILIDPCTGISDPATMKLGLQISPNPNSGIFTLTLTNGNKGPVEMSVTDASGRTVLQRTLAIDKPIISIPIDLGKQPKGIYIVRLKSDHETETKKMVVN